MLLLKAKINSIEMYIIQYNRRCSKNDGQSLGITILEVLMICPAMF